MTPGPKAIAMATLACALLGLGTAGTRLGWPGETTSWPPRLRAQMGVSVSYALGHQTGPLQGLLDEGVRQGHAVLPPGDLAARVRVRDMTLLLGSPGCPGMVRVRRAREGLRQSPGSGAAGSGQSFRITLREKSSSIRY